MTVAELIEILDSMDSNASVVFMPAVLEDLVRVQQVRLNDSAYVQVLFDPIEQWRE